MSEKEYFSIIVILKEMQRAMTGIPIFKGGSVVFNGYFSLPQTSLRGITVQNDTNT